MYFRVICDKNVFTIQFAEREIKWLKNIIKIKNFIQERIKITKKAPARAKAKISSRLRALITDIVTRPTRCSMFSKERADLW